jgi:hypothetical protein
MSATIVQQYMKSIAWYQPTTDTDDWVFFNQQCYSQPYGTSSTELLKKIAWIFSTQFNPGLDVGMWTGLKNNFADFLNKNIMLIDDGSVCSELIQLDFIACFQNSYNKASHNNDLWQSFNDNAQRVLQAPSAPGSVINNNQAIPAITINPQYIWQKALIVQAYLKAIKELRYSYWAPTVDTDTWASFQGIILEVNDIPFVNITLKAALVMSNLSSPVDPTPWHNISQAATAFLNKYLGVQINGSVEEYQLNLAISFFNIPTYGYNSNSHNADLWQKYFEAFKDALNMIYPPHLNESSALLEPTPVPESID